MSRKVLVCDGVSSQYEVVDHVHWCVAVIKKAVQEGA